MIFPTEIQRKCECDCKIEFRGRRGDEKRREEKRREERQDRRGEEKRRETR